MKKSESGHAKNEFKARANQSLRWQRFITLPIGALALLVGLLVLFGWAKDIATLKSLRPDWVAMKVNTALCFSLAGAAVLSLTLTTPRHRRLLTLGLALPVAVIGLLTLAEYIFDWNPGLDQFLIAESPGAVGTSHPGRMAPDTALCFTLLSLALAILCLFGKNTARFWAATISGTLVMAAPLAAIFSYLANAIGPFGFWGLTIMALHTALLFVLLGVAVIAASWPAGLPLWSLTGRYALMFVTWSLLVFISLCWGMHQQSHHLLQSATVAARANINKDISFRRWGSSHGGVYVKPSPRTPPNPYLNVPDRDVTTNQGINLTLMNPAYMLREMQRDFGDSYGTTSRITSLNPLNPLNAPDKWQKKALAMFARGKRDLIEIDFLENQPYLRMMLPIYTEKPCLKCHARQGYQEGDVRGGIDTIIPLKPFLTRATASNTTLTLSHAGIWLIGITALLLFYHREYVLDEINQKAEEEKQILEGKLRQAQKMEAIGTLAGGIAHDFNNILSVIFGYNELAMREDDPEKRHHYLEELLKGGQRAKDLVAQILAFSRKTEQQMLPLNIAPIAKETLKMLRASIPATIEIRQEIAATNSLVLADPTQIHQVLLNLCTNAYQAMRERGGILTVSLKEKAYCGHAWVYDYPEPGSYVCLEVSDTGPGIAPELQEKIFEPYFTTKKLGEGTGLGLAVVHGIVKAHHGHVMVSSEPGKGTSFQVCLPLTLEKDEGRQAPVTVKTLSGKGERLMVVDDEGQIGEVIAAILDRSGYKVKTFKESPAALAEFASNPAGFDLVLTDMTMPYMTGVELALKIMEIRPQTPVIICTGHSDLINREQAMALGIKDYLIKPVPRDVLISAVDKALASRQNHPS